MKKIITVSATFSVIILTLIILYFLFPVSIIDGNIYNTKKLNEQSKQYENNVKVLIEVKTNELIKYIDTYSTWSETELLTKTDLIEFKDKNKFIGTSVIQIDDSYYSLAAINELRNSMKTISSYLISKIKDVMIKGVNDQTIIYLSNIDNYTDWYYSFSAGIDRTITNIIGMFSGEHSSEERFYTENFNRIMNNNADFESIIGYDKKNLLNIIKKIYDEFLELKNYFAVDIRKISANSITSDDYIEPFIENISLYFDTINKSLNNANYYFLQEYTIKDNYTVRAAQADVLKRQIYNSVIKNQNIKIEIIKDPSYLFDKLSIGSVIFVDNYFVGFNTYQHYGVYIGNGKVIHFAPYAGQEISMENGIIHETTLEKFLNGRALQFDMNIEKRFSDEEIVRRARSRVNEKGYNLLSNNCEHFARWCVTGERISYQVTNLPQKIDTTYLIIKEKIDKVSEFLELFN